MKEKTLERKKQDPLLVVVIGALVTFRGMVNDLHTEFLELLAKGQTHQGTAEDMFFVEREITLIYENIKYILKVAQVCVCVCTYICLHRNRFLLKYWIRERRARRLLYLFEADWERLSLSAWRQPLDRCVSRLLALHEGY